MHASGEGARSSSLLVAKLVAAWALVGIPLIWGVSQVVVTSLDLFR
jgi:hypothetical protein